MVSQLWINCFTGRYAALTSRDLATTSLTARYRYGDFYSVQISLASGELQNITLDKLFKSKNFEEITSGSRFNIEARLPAEFLKYCDIVDTPGFNANNDDNTRALSILENVNYCLYIIPNKNLTEINKNITRKKMSIYYSFNDFMTEVIDKADSISQQKNNCGLEDLFNVSLATLMSTKNILKIGWPAFFAVIALFSLGPLAFGLALTSFLLTPAGITISLIFGAAVYSKIKAMYHDKKLPQAVKSIGENFKPRWEYADDNTSLINNLLHEAALTLYEEANSGTVHSYVEVVVNQTFD